MKKVNLETYKTNNKRIDNWISTHLYGFLIKSDKSVKHYHEEIAHVIDYLKSKESPRKITRLGFLDAIELSKQWTEKLNKKAETDETDDDVEVILQKEDYRWVKLKTEKSYQREGKLMQHCVASYFQRESCFIYSLRDNKNEPHCTIEIIPSSNKVNQVKGKNNRAVIGKYHKPIIEFLNSTNFKISHHDLNKFGAVKVQDKIFHIDDLPERTIIDDNLIGYYFSRLPKDLKINGNLSLENSLADHPVDISNWNIQGTIHLKGVNLKQKELKSVNLFVFNLGEACIDEISVDKVDLYNSSIIAKKINCKILGAKQTEINCSNINVSSVLELEKMPHKVILNKNYKLSTLSVIDTEIEIESPIEVEKLVLHNAKISKESLMNIKVTKGCTILDKENSIFIPAWDLKSFLDIKDARVSSIAKGFKTRALFVIKDDIKIFKDCGISGNYDNDIDNASSFDVQEIYALPNP